MRTRAIESARRDKNGKRGDAIAFTLCATVLAREDGKLLTQWGRHGRQPGQFKWVHNIAIASKGNLYTAEVGWGRRTLKFRRM